MLRHDAMDLRLRFGLLCSILALSAALGCSSSTQKPADSPEEPSSPEKAAQVDAPAEGEPRGDGPAPMPTEVKQTGAHSDGSIPDNYELTAGDCDALGKQYGAVARADQLAQVNPKLSAAQRTQAEANIDKVISKLENQWIDGCRGSLVGKTVDPKSLKCALESRTVKDFDVCLNGEEAPKK